MGKTEVKDRPGKAKQSKRIRWSRSYAWPASQDWNNGLTRTSQTYVKVRKECPKSSWVWGSLIKWTFHDGVWQIRYTIFRQSILISWVAQVSCKPRFLLSLPNVIFRTLWLVHRSSYWFLSVNPSSLFVLVIVSLKIRLLTNSVEVLFAHFPLHNSFTRVETFR